MTVPRFLRRPTTVEAIRIDQRADLHDAEMWLRRQHVHHLRDHSGINVGPPGHRLRLRYGDWLCRHIEHGTFTVVADDLFLLEHRPLLVAVGLPHREEQ